MATSSHAHCTRDLELYIRGSRGERRGERGGGERGGGERRGREEGRRGREEGERGGEREEGERGGRRERRGREEGERGGGERRGREVWKVKTQPSFSKLRELNMAVKHSRFVVMQIASYHIHTSHWYQICAEMYK